MDLAALSDFVLIVAHGGIAQASRASQRPKASLSRRVMQLEADLGIRLFDRGARALRLTEDGELFHARLVGPLAEIEEATADLRDRGVRPQGRLRVSVPVVFGQLLMGRLAAEFARAYPSVTLDICVEDRAVDLIAEGYDVVVRLNPAPDTSLVGHRLTWGRMLIVAAPSLRRPGHGPGAGEPLPVVLRTAWSEGTWRLPHPEGPEVRTRTVLELPSFPMVRDAVLTGIGAAKLPQILVADDLAAGRLVEWGAASDHPEELWILHASSRLASAKIRAFVGLVRAAFPTEGRGSAHTRGREARCRDGLALGSIDGAGTLWEAGIVPSVERKNSPAPVNFRQIIPILTQRRCGPPTIEGEAPVPDGLQLEGSSCRDSPGTRRVLPSSPACSAVW